MDNDDESLVNDMAEEIKRLCNDFDERKVNPIVAYAAISSIRKSILNAYTEGSVVGDVIRRFDFLAETPVGSVVGRC